MRSNHKGQRVFGILFLIFSLIMAPLAFANVACIFSEEFRMSYTKFLQDFNLETVPVPSKDDFVMAIVFGAVFLVLFFIAIRYLSYSSLRGMVKMNDVFNQKISVKVRIRFYKLLNVEFWLCTLCLFRFFHICHLLWYKVYYKQGVLLFDGFCLL